MIIFGWRTIVSTIGAVFKKMCDHCHNEDYWILTKATKWFTLFFIPVIPLDTKYFLACPVCKYGLTLKGEQIKTIKPIAEINQQFVNGKITQAQHTYMLNQLNVDEASSNQSAKKITTAGSVTKENRKFAYCGSCGNKLEGDSKFCGNCGSATTSI